MASTTTTQDRTGTARDQDTVREVLDEVRADGREALSAPEAKRVADAYGIPVPGEGLATSADEAVSLAEEMGYPVVAKIVSPDILHKTEANGVLVGLASGEEVRKGFDTSLVLYGPGVLMASGTRGGGTSVEPGSAYDVALGREQPAATRRKRGRMVSRRAWTRDMATS